MQIVKLSYEFKIKPIQFDDKSGEEHWLTACYEYIPYDETVQDVIIEFVADKYNIESGNLYGLLDDLNAWDKILNAYYDIIYEALWERCYKLAEEEFKDESKNC